MRNEPHRSRAWQTQHADTMDDIAVIFGQSYPTLREVSIWKTSWYDSTTNTFKLEHNFSRVKIRNVCNQCGIHSYFWDAFTDTNGNKQVSFYYEEHLVMFKLTW
jgi:hypothetical protein